MKGLSFEQWISEDSFITEISDDVLLNLQNIFIKEFQCIQGYAITCCSYEEINNNIKMIRLVDLLKWRGGEYRMEAAKKRDIDDIANITYILPQSFSFS